VLRLFRIDPERRAEFEGIYGTGGLLSELCRQHQGFLGNTLKLAEASSEYFEFVEHWQTYWDWQEFRSRFVSQRNRLAGLAREAVLSGQIVATYYESSSGLDDGPELHPA
jgi:hypothetical protein